VATELKPYQKLQDFWRRTKSDITYRPTSEDAVSAIEHEYSIYLPAQFREYLLKSCPFGSGLDDSYTDWWSLERISSVAEEYKGWEKRLKNNDVLEYPHSYLFFADYSIWCWAWAICCKQGPNYGRVVQIDKIDDHFVANDFSQFVNEYIETDAPWFDEQV